MGGQTTHNQHPFESKTFPIIVVCDGVSAPANVGGLFRICEAFGVERIVFCNASVDMGSSRMKKTARSTDHKVPRAFYEDTVEAIDDLKEQGYHILALEITGQSSPLRMLEITPPMKLALVIGHEAYGISEKILEYSDAVTHIPMYGSNSSMNLVQACGIALYALTTKLNV